MKGGERILGWEYRAKEGVSVTQEKLSKEILEVICKRLDRQKEKMDDEVLESVAFVNTNNAVIMIQLCDVVNSLKELGKEVIEIKNLWK